MNATHHVVIVGSGHAGGTAAGMLRQKGFAGRITLIGDEAAPPYHRPPLSKAWLIGEANADTVKLKSDNFYQEQEIDLRLNSTVTTLDRESKQVILANGEVLPYDKLILSTGARARALQLPGVHLEGVYSLRSAPDAERLREALVPGGTLVVIGGGFIGLEVASAARALGVSVIVIECDVRLLARVASEPLSEFFLKQHREAGVMFEFGLGVRAFNECDGKVCGVTLSDGREVACDAVLVCVGAMPNDELARSAGLECPNGVAVDTHSRTISDPDIFAIGDMSCRLSQHDSRPVRLESVPAAMDQARQVACAIVGEMAPSPEVPWFWSDQYQIKLQIAGLRENTDEFVVRGDPNHAKFGIFHLRDRQLVAVEAINSPGEFIVGKRLISLEAKVDPLKLADIRVSMNAVTAS